MSACRTVVGFMTADTANMVVPRFVDLAFSKLKPFERCPLCDRISTGCFYVRETSNTRYFVDNRNDKNSLITDQTFHFRCENKRIQIVQTIVEYKLIKSACQVERNNHLYITEIDFDKQRTSFRKTRDKTEQGYEFNITGCRKRFFLSESVEEWCDSLDKFFNFA